MVCVLCDCLASLPPRLEPRIVQLVQAFSLGVGLFAAGQRALLLIQYTGLLDSVNALRGVAMEGQNPVCMMVGLLGKEPGVAPTKSKRYGVRIVEPVLDAMEIEHQLIEEAGDVGKIVPAIEKAYRTTRPMTLLIGREPL